MPKVVNLQHWEKTFREQVRNLASGWNAVESRGRIRLKVRLPGQAEQSVVLPFEWSNNDVGDAYIRVRSIYKLMDQGLDLRAAADQADGKAPQVIRDWQGAAERFRKQKLQHGNTISEATWDKGYRPVLEMAVSLLSGSRPPGRPLDLIDRCVADWAPGSRMRQIRCQSLSQFLRHCVEREQFPAHWLPPSDLSHHVGRKPAGSEGKGGGDPISDAEILRLIASLPDDAAGLRWRDAIRLMAELGLRPVELLHLSVRMDRSTGEPHWWCNYRKRSGGGITEPRRVYPLPLQDEGALVSWNLLARWQARLIHLPPLQSGNGAADGLGTYLKRQPAWRSLRDEVESRGERLVPYSFRHSYSLRAHRRNLVPSTDREGQTTAQLVRDSGGAARGTADAAGLPCNGLSRGVDPAEGAAAS
ncbi:site-specific integrase [Synechococcus sp. CBW1004]|uniref:site-specific integrase n=1 Tax=Synechococcus sp. CBW1004 TaxID=1353136 RepID=UPI001E40CC54|nr:site-specific integrase [Synechococcus sp. CBW1004]